jgi:hypothetical protein
MGIKENRAMKHNPKNPASLQPLDDLALPVSAGPAASPLNDSIWKRMLFVIALSGVAWLTKLLFGWQTNFSIWASAILLGAAWYLALAILLLETKAKKFWIFLLAGSLVFVFFFSPSRRFWIEAVLISFLFLLIRKYRPYRCLTSRRRAFIFLLGFILLNLLTWGWFIGPESGLLLPQGSESIQGLAAKFNLPGLGQNISQFSLWSLRLFLFFTLLHLFFRIRLHFLKIRSKLAVGAVLIALVPLILVVLMATVVL